MIQKNKLFRRVLNIFVNRKFIFTFLFFIIGFSLFAQPFAVSSQGGTSPSSYGVTLPATPATGGSNLNPANWGSNIMSAIIQQLVVIPAVIIILVCGVAALLLSFTAQAAALLLQFVLSPDFINISYTNPANNPIIKIGLDVTQGLVNMALVLVLVYIALTTILRIAGYETKKLLVTFIIVALLVNFAPLICGLIVDASNILMNAFISKVEIGTNFFSKFTGILSTIVERVKGMITTNNQKQVQEIAALAGQLMAFCAVYLCTTLIYLLFAFVFIARYIVIWMLVILSPLAFACYILPNTKKIWQTWWNQFLQWCFVGVTCLFFLYLGEKVTEQMSTGAIQIKEPAPVTGDQSQNNPQVPINAIASLFIGVVPLGFLGIGLIFGLQTSAMGATAVMGIVTKSGKWVGKKAGGRAWKTIEDKTRIREGAKGLVSAIDRSKAGKLVRWAVPDKLRKYSENRAAMDSLGDKYKSESSVALMDGFWNGRFSGVESGKVLDMVAKERGDGSDVVGGFMRKYKYKERGLTEADMYNDPNFLKNPILRRALEVNHGAGNLGKIMRNEPRLAAALADSDIDDGKWKGKTAQDVLKKYMADTKNSDISNWEKEVPQHHASMEVFMGQKYEDSYNALVGLKGGVATSLKTLDENYSKQIDEWAREGSADVARLTSKAGSDIRYKQKTFERYMDHLEKKYEIKEGELGYRKALENPRFTSRGWRALEYVNPSLRGGGSTTARPTPPPAPTPGSAATGAPPATGGFTPPPPGSTPFKAKPKPPGRRAGGGSGKP